MCDLSVDEILDTLKEEFPDRPQQWIFGGTAAGKTTLTREAVERIGQRMVDERVFAYAPQYAPILMLQGGRLPRRDGGSINVRGLLERRRRFAALEHARAIEHALIFGDGIARVNWNPEPERRQNESANQGGTLEGREREPRRRGDIRDGICNLMAERPARTWLEP